MSKEARLRILGVIDHFGPGGAQRQFAELMAGLADRGHSVEVFTYHLGHDFFLDRVTDAGVPIRTADRGSDGIRGVASRLHRILREGGFDVAIAFLDRPSLLLELTGTVAGRVRVVVSERASHLADTRPLRDLGRRFTHNLAAAVVANSHSHADWLRARRWLRTPVSVIYNGLTLQAFDPTPNPPDGPESLHLLGIGRIGPEKNVLNLIRALDLAASELGEAPRLDWVGGDDVRPRGLKYRVRVDDLLAHTPRVAARWRWLGHRSDVPDLLASHHALVHPSLHEGLPNAVCEALACGRPVLASDRCDHPRLVKDGVRGFLFDPDDPEAIARAIVDAARMSRDQWVQMGLAARAYAVEALDGNRMVSEYEQLFHRLVDPSKNRGGSACAD